MVWLVPEHICLRGQGLSLPPPRRQITTRRPIMEDNPKLVGDRSSIRERKRITTDRSIDHFGRKNIYHGSSDS